MNRHLIRSAFLAASIAVAAFVPIHAGPAGCGNAFAAAAAPDAPGPFWARAYGGDYSHFASGLVVTPDDGLAVAGYADLVGIGQGDAWVLRLDKGGKILWQKAYGGAESDYALSLVAVPDGGFAIAGYTGSFGAGSNDAWVIKLDRAGNLLWQKTYGGTASDIAWSLIATTDGFVVAGYTESFGAGGYDAWVLRIDAVGNVLWQKTFGGANEDRFYGLAATPDGGYAVAGLTYSFGAGGSDVWVMRLDGAGNVRWQKTYGGSNSDVALSLAAAPDGGLAVAGYTYSFGAGFSDVWVLRLDAAGNTVWQKSYGGAGGDVSYSLAATGDGGFAVAGYTDSFGAGNGDAWVMKLDAAGNVAWQRTYGAPTYDYAYSLVATPDGGLAVGGAARNDAAILRLAPNGAISPGCDLVGTSNAIVQPTSAAGVSSAATVAESGAAVASSTAAVADSTADAALFCAYRPHP